MTYTGGTTLNAGILFLDSWSAARWPRPAARDGQWRHLRHVRYRRRPDGGGAFGHRRHIALGANTLTTNSAANTTLATQIIDGGLGGGTGGR